MRSGAIWSYLQGGLGSVIQFGSGIILARLLNPDDFGVFFAVTAYTVFLSSQIKFGIPEALLQASELEEEQWNSAFWIMEGIALLSMLIVFAAGPLLSDFYEDDRYLNIAYLMALGFPVIPFMSINGTLLRRRMDFKTGSIIQLKSALLGTGASITTAFLDFGPYCFVVGGLSGTLLSSYLMARAAPWHPYRNFKLSSFKNLFNYAWRIHLNNSIFTLTSRVDSMIMGKLVGMSGLGLFMRAQSLAYLPREKIVTPIYQLAFSGFSRIQHDLKYSQSMYQKILCATTSAVYPLLLLFIFVGDGLIYYLYGEKWLPAALPFMILTIGVFFSVITTITSTLAEAHNLVARQTPIEIINLVLTVIAIFIGANWGLAGIATGITIKLIISNLLTMRLVRTSHLTITTAHVFAAIYPAILSSMAGLLAGIGAISFANRIGMEKTDLLYMLTVGTAIGIAYLATWLMLVLMKREDPVLQSNYQLARQLLSRVYASISPSSGHV